MSNRVKDKDIRNWTGYIFNDIINIKKLDPDKIQIVEKSDKSKLVYWIGICDNQRFEISKN